MSSGFEESTKSASPPNSTCCSENSSNKDAGDFECNICFDSARDPVVTLCGHLFCWPCLYRWLHHRSHCRGCPVCKALVEEEKLVPLYGKGKSLAGPRITSYLGMEIPPRPLGQRPQTVTAEEEEFEEEEEELDEEEPEEEEVEEDEEEVPEEEELVDPEYVAPPDIHLVDIHTMLARLEQRFKEYIDKHERLKEYIDQRFEEIRAAFARLEQRRAGAEQQHQQRINESHADAE